MSDCGVFLEDFQGDKWKHGDGRLLEDPEFVHYAQWLSTHRCSALTPNHDHQLFGRDSKLSDVFSLAN